MSNNFKTGNKLWFIHIVEYYIGIRMNKLGLPAMDDSHKCYIELRNDTEEYILSLYKQAKPTYGIRGTDNA